MRVPIDTKSVRTSMVMKNAKNPATMPVNIVALNGVWYFGCTLENHEKKRPSLDIAK
jgi:hypothetical protein